MTNLNKQQSENDLLVEEMNEEIERIRPEWIDPIEVYDIASIQQGGCASGAYMPAVTYHIANETMLNHGDDVLEYIEQQLGELPEIPKGESWSGIAVFFLSYAVELFASQFDIDNLEY